MARQMMVSRVYDDPSRNEGLRVLVDRGWPRLVQGCRPSRRVDRGRGPATPLRRKYGHHPERFTEFRRRHLAELAEPRPAAEMNRLRRLASPYPFGSPC
jgi:uncharacterized protein YeaO (DUF488 family)